MTAEHWKNRIKEEGEEDEITIVSSSLDNRRYRGKWGRILNLFSFGGMLRRSRDTISLMKERSNTEHIKVGNDCSLEDEEGRTLIQQSCPNFEKALDFNRYHHVFQVFSSSTPFGESVAGVPEPQDRAPTPIALLVTLRLTFSCEIISLEEMQTYGAAVGCLTLQSFRSKRDVTCSS